jgi:hypothetical protein
MNKTRTTRSAVNQILTFERNFKEFAVEGTVMSKDDKKAIQLIGFRIEEGDAEAAKIEAQKFGISPHALAKQVFLEWLNDTERFELREALEHLREEVIKQKADLKEAMIAVLCDAGKLEEAEAREWVESRFFH